MSTINNKALKNNIENINFVIDTAVTVNNIIDNSKKLKTSIENIASIMDIAVTINNVIENSKKLKDFLAKNIIKPEPDLIVKTIPIYENNIIISNKILELLYIKNESLHLLKQNYNNIIEKLAIVQNREFQIYGDNNTIFLDEQI